jgi:hypothetical protein
MGIRSMEKQLKAPNIAMNDARKILDFAEQII